MALDIIRSIEVDALLKEQKRGLSLARQSGPISQDLGSEIIHGTQDRLEELMDGLPGTVWACQLDRPIIDDLLRQ